tara:strand:- start:3421 stop:4692 length:1272 start_codon:yes stop_codon:yes gene_type:complete
VAFEFRLPDIGEGLEDAEIVSWYVSPGDVVERDQPLLEVLTDKASSELPSPVAGKVLKLSGQEGDRIKVGDVLIEIEEPVTSPPQGNSLEQDTKIEESKPEKNTSHNEEQKNFISVAPKVKASPATRKLARELAVDISSISGTGSSGRITNDDVQLASESDGTSSRPLSPVSNNETSSPPVQERSNLGFMKPGEHKVKGVRGVIAKNMSAAWAEIPHIHSLDEVDASLLIDFRNRLKKVTRQGASKITPLSIIATATVRALKKYPMMNGHVVGSPAEKIIIPPSINLGIAVASESGLLVPVISEANSMNIFELAEKISELVELAREHKITVEQMQGTTFTITNYGSLGGRWALPVISLGQAGILGVGKIEERPVAVDGKVEARPTLPIVLGADHRLIDGDVAEAFKNSIMNDLLEPLNLLVTE